MSLQTYLTREFLVSTLNDLPALHTPVIDGIYRRAVNHPFPYISLNKINTPAQNIPLSERGTQAHVMGQNLMLDLFEPKPVRPSLFISAREMSDFNAMTGVDKNQFLAGKVDFLRQACRKTAEAMAALTLNGSYKYPVEGLNGVELASVELGTLQEAKVTKWKDTTTVGQIIESLENLADMIRAQGYGNEIAFIVAPNVRQFLYEVLSKVNHGSNLASFDPTTQDLIFGGHRIKSLSTTYFDYATQTTCSTLAAGTVIAIDLAADHKMIYCATEDVQNNFGALPFVVSQYESPDINGIKLFGQCKPFPAPVLQAMCKASVLA